MVDLVNFLQQYGAALLRPLVLILWLIIYHQTKKSKLIRYHVKLFVFFLVIFIAWNIVAIIFANNRIYARYVYLFFWSTATIYEFFIVIKAIFLTQNLEKKYNHVLIIILIALSIPVLLAAILSLSKRTYNPINTTDFYNIILLLCGTVLIIRNILSGSFFIDNIESFFIYTGFALYFGLHILATNTVSLNFRHYWFFGQYATLIALIYWMGSVFFIWKIKSKHLY
ncbi:MAG: hypothetical protein K9N07_03700 [Candidatus Cloacimonetes bacterium]|nr:hypothetical protein [Candidatus Cloacimonadota bacterium]